MADLIISQPMTFTVDVKNGLVERPQRESLMRGDKMANRIIAELVYGSEPFDITGVTVKGKFCRPPSGDEIDLAGEAKGNVAEVQLTDQCYTSGGHYEARVILVLGGVERTVLFISGDVLKGGSGKAAGDEETGGTGSGLPAGGTAGQVLVKVSSAQGDAIWKMLTAADVGALGKNETAVNANALNGKDAKYYSRPRNLLDNSYWENPKEIVNQRGQTSYTANGYAIDRWQIWNGSLEIGDGYIAVKESFQVLDIDLNKTYTLAAKTDEGIVVVTGNFTTPVHSSLGSLIVTMTSLNGYAEVILTAASGYETGKVIWAALYEGSYTADNLPPYRPKGYAVELAECQMYYRLIGDNVLSFIGMTTSVGDGGLFKTPFDMRKGAVPTFEYSGDMYARVNGVDYKITGLVHNGTDTGGVEIFFSANGVPAKHAATGHISGGTFAISKDL